MVLSVSGEASCAIHRQYSSISDGSRQASIALPPLVAYAGARLPTRVLQTTERWVSTLSR